MRTDDLIQAMTADVGVTPKGAPQARLALAGLAGVGIALILVLAWLKLRPDLSAALSGGFFWIKAAYTAAIGAVFYRAAERLGRPGASARNALVAGGVIVAAFLIVGLIQWFGRDSAERMALVRGGSWTVCTRNILILGAPTTLIAVMVMRRLAPTRPVLAGFSAGMFAGSVAATVYGLHCPESTAVFVALWYSLGLLSCGFLGAALGRIALRW